MYKVSLLLIGFVLVSCNFAVPTQVPAFLPLTGSQDDTATSIPPTEVPSFTPTTIPSTAPPSLTPEPTYTPFVIVAFSPTADIYTAAIGVNLPNVPGTVYVHANTLVTITDYGSDNKVNNCHILKQGFDLKVSLPVGTASTAFKLASGTYKLNCGIPNVNTTIQSQ
jgi:hypothetical protein